MIFSRKLLTLIGVVVVLVFSGLLLYFATQMSATYPPIKEYHIKQTLKEFEERVHLLSTNKNLTILDKYSVGEREDEFRYYISMQLIIDSSEYRFDFNYELEQEPGAVQPYINFKLIGVHDLKKGIGGYHAEDKGVSQCINVFEENILTKLVLTKRQ